MTTPLRYGTAFARICFLFIIANLIYFLRPVTCWDCSFPYGVPLTFYQKGGEGGGAGIVWKGLAGDVASIIVVALLVGRAWQALATQSKQR
jgi:hypothetical protein